ncbi:MAG: hypothetical protein ACYDBJ_29025 [Aggregatilineales bacterium]
MPTVRLLSAPSAQGVQSAQIDGGVQVGSIKAKIQAYLATNPDAKQMSINEVLTGLSAQGVRAGRTTVTEVLREIKKKPV